MSNGLIKIISKKLGLKNKNPSAFGKDLILVAKTGLEPVTSGL